MNEEKVGIRTIKLGKLFLVYIKNIIALIMLFNIFITMFK